MKKYIITITSLITLLVLTGCMNTPTNGNSEPAAEPQPIIGYEPLQNTTSFTLTKEILSFNKSYSMTTNSNEKYTFEGKTFRLGGDTVKVKNPAGDVIATDQQLSITYSFSVNRMAEITNANGELTGFIGESSSDLFSLTKNFTFYDINGNQVAHGKQNFSISPSFKITNNDGTLAYKIEGELLSFQDKYYVEVLDNSVVPVEYVAIFTIIGNETKDKD